MRNPAPGAGRAVAAWLAAASFVTIGCGSALGQGVPAGVPRPEPLQLSPAPAPAAERLNLGAPASIVPAISLQQPVRVRAFRISGLTAFPEAELLAVLAPWAGRELSQADLEQAAGGLEQALRSRGLIVAQAYVPQQDIVEGVVSVTVIEGRIGEVRLDVPEGARLRRATAERFLARLQPGDTLRRDNVEHSLLLLNDLPGTRLTASLAPAPAPGTADIIARMESEAARPFSARLTLDNAGVRGVGEARAIADLRASSPFSLGDLFTARLMQTGAGGQTLGSVTYGLPVNGAGTRMGVRYTSQRYRLGDEFAAFEGHGDYRAASVLLSHPLVRRNDRNLSLSFSRTEQTFHDRLDAIAYASDVRQTLNGAGIAADFIDGWLGGGFTSLQANYIAGRVSLDTPALAAQDAAPGGPGINGAYSLTRLRIEHDRFIGPSSSLHVSLSAQSASKNLYSGNELGVGGPDAVRAYAVGELFADRGVVARVEYRREMAFLEGERTVLSFFHDQARVDVNRNALATDTANRRGFGGYGFGLYQTFAQRFTLQLSSAWRSGSPPPGSGPERLPRVWAAASSQF